MRSSTFFMILFVFALLFVFLSCHNNTKSYSKNEYKDSITKDKENNVLDNTVNSELIPKSENPLVANQLIGTYEVSEIYCDRPRTVILSVYEDETATMRYKNSETIHYGTWYKYGHMKFARFFFSNKNILLPHLTFGIYNKELSHFVLMDGYMYYSSSAAKAKNPKDRIKLKRVSI